MSTTAALSPALRIGVVGWSVYVPDRDSPVWTELPDPGPVPPAAAAKQILGRKGLLYKEPATRLALCAVHRALGLPDGDGERPERVDPETAVVASVNLGNVETIRDVVRGARAEGWRSVSPLAAPNASSNIVASTVAIWFGFGGPNVTVCSGATAGLDAVAIATRLIRARRARRVVVVGVEPEDEVACALHAQRAGAIPLAAGAGCVLLAAADRFGDAPVLGRVRAVPAGQPAPLCPGAEARYYGAAGVIAVAAAAARLIGTPPSGATGAAPIDVCCGDEADGWRVVQLDRGSRP